MGLALALTARTGRHVIAGLAVLTGLASGVELLQSMPAIGRSCDTIDVADTMIGAVLGTVAGLPFRSVALRPRYRVNE